MAIIIPSSKTYDRQNPKVRDNVIERIEVETNTVVPNNEYDVSVFNNSYSNIFSIGAKQEDYQRDVDGYAYFSYEAFVEVIPSYANIEKVIIPIKKKNSYIDKLYIGEDDEENPNIKFSLIGTINKGVANKTFNYKTGQGLIKYETNYQQPTTIEKDIRYNLPNKEIKEEISAPLYEAVAKVTINDLSNISTVDYRVENDSYILENLTILSGMKFAKLKGKVSFIDPDNWGDYKLDGIYEEYIPHTIEITINGNTIGIDFTDNVVKIGNVTSKKVQTVERNELMQTQNYYEVIIDYPINVRFIRKLGTQANYVVLDLNINKDFSIGDQFIYNGEQASIFGFSNEGYEVAVMEFGEIYNAFITNGQKEITAFYQESGKISMIEKNFAKTVEAYKNGKETATIRCSIGDYYDENTQKVISTDNSTKKMSFDLYDQVIPMVYGVNGKDRPMSLYKDGTPKVFQVLVKKVYYDGAVWQELTLQEI